MPDEILVPLGGTNESLRALPVALALARALDAGTRRHSLLASAAYAAAVVRPNAKCAPTGIAACSRDGCPGGGATPSRGSSLSAGMVAT